MELQIQPEKKTKKKQLGDQTYYLKTKKKRRSGHAI